MLFFPSCFVHFNASVICPFKFEKLVTIEQDPSPVHITVKHGCNTTRHSSIQIVLAHTVCHIDLKTPVSTQTRFHYVTYCYIHIIGYFVLKPMLYNYFSYSPFHTLAKNRSIHPNAAVSSLFMLLIRSGNINKSKPVANTLAAVA